MTASRNGTALTPREPAENRQLVVWYARHLDTMAALIVGGRSHFNPPPRSNSGNTPLNVSPHLPPSTRGVLDCIVEYTQPHPPAEEEDDVAIGKETNCHCAEETLGGFPNLIGCSCNLLQPNAKRTFSGL